MTYSRIAAPFTVVVLVLGALALSAGGSAAEPDDPPDPTSTLPPTSDSGSTSTTVGSTPSSQATTSTSFLPPPPTLGPLPLIELDPEFQASDGPALNYKDQPAFDPTSNDISVANLSDAQRRLSQAEADATRAVQLTQKLRFKLSKIENRLGALSDEEQQLVVEAAGAYELFVDRAADAYMRGNDADFITLLTSKDLNEYGTRAAMVRAVLDADQSALDGYQKSRDALSDELVGLHEELGTTERAIKWSRLNEKVTRHTVADTTIEVAMWQAGAQVFARNFLFPVHGLADFGDSWGAPRMVGTPYQHWHQGTDIFAPAGTELVAVEDGVISRTSEGTLGGISLYLAGGSGIEYYYAHLSGYAPGVQGGLVVHRGDVVGYLGDTGNAKGGAPHLHFEIHVDGHPVNPYPILAVAYQIQAPLLALVPQPASLPAAAVQPTQPTTTTTLTPLQTSPPTTVSGG
jgi:murein DD-endopeptidase MepM/ murein hydrolase activator NlpD